MLCNVPLCALLGVLHAYASVCVSHCLLALPRRFVAPTRSNELCSRSVSAVFDVYTAYGVRMYGCVTLSLVCV